MVGEVKLKEILNMDSFQPITYFKERTPGATLSPVFKDSVTNSPPEF